MFATDLGQLDTTESENNTRVSVSGQVFMLRRFVKILFCHICITFSVDFC